MTLPKDFELYTVRLMGDDLYSQLRRGLEEEAPVSIRLNPCKVDTAAVGSRLQHDGAQPVAWCKDGFYLADRPAFTFDPLLHAGLYYVQEASSMFVCEVVRQLIKQPVLMLDLCAAPGGKTTALRSVLPEKSLLFANEPVKVRASVLSENIQKFGNPDVVVTNNYPRDYRKAKLTFDAILADVPCSGEGMFRKDANAISEWSTANVEKCSTLQRSIIEDIWPCLRPGGLLVYSTCTFNAHEDEDNVAWIAETLGADFVEIKTPEEWGITGSLVGNIPVYRFIPGKTRGEGLFMAVLRKRGDSSSEYFAAPQSTNRKTNKKTVADEWIKDGFRLIAEKDFIRAVPESWTSIYNNVKSKLHVIHAGVGIGTIKGHDIIPDASLALSAALNKDAFPTVELSYAEAVSFLRKETLVFPSSAKRGFTLVSYGGHPLGFVKNVGTRANNLYPQEWKIRSSYAPAETVDVLKL